MLVLTIVVIMAALAAWTAWFSVRKVRRIGAARYFGAVGRLGIAVTVVAVQFVGLVFGRLLDAWSHSSSSEEESDPSLGATDESFEEYTERTVLSISDDYAVVPERKGHL